MFHNNNNKHNLFKAKGGTKERLQINKFTTKSEDLLLGLY